MRRIFSLARLLVSVLAMLRPCMHEARDENLPICCFLNALLLLNCVNPTTTQGFISDIIEYKEKK